MIDPESGSGSGVSHIPCDYCQICGENGDCIGTCGTGQSCCPSRWGGYCRNEITETSCCGWANECLCVNSQCRVPTSSPFVLTEMRNPSYGVYLRTAVHTLSETSGDMSVPIQKGGIPINEYFIETCPGVKSTAPLKRFVEIIAPLHPSELPPVISHLTGTPALTLK